MKTLIGILLISLAAISLQGQDFSQHDNHTFKVSKDYKAAEPMILEMTNFILSNEINDDSPNHRTAVKVLLLWMTGTPDYEFGVDESFSPFMKKNEKLISIFMASLANYALKNRDQLTNPKQMKKGSYETFLEYCAKTENGVTKFKELNKALEAKSEGTLDAYLKL